MRGCVEGAEAAHVADTTHSGVMQAVNHTSCKRSYNCTTGGDHTNQFTIPQTAALLDETKSFALCYALHNGSAADRTWREYLSFLKERHCVVQSVEELVDMPQNS